MSDELLEAVSMNEAWEIGSETASVVRWLTFNDGRVLFWGAEQMPKKEVPFTVMKAADDAAKGRVANGTE